MNHELTLRFSSSACLFITGVVAGIAVTLVYQRAFSAWIRAYVFVRDYSAIVRARAQFAARRKGKILAVGTLEQGPDGQMHPVNFHIRPEPGAPAMYRGPDGDMCWAGYTEPELIEIARRGKEFAP